MAEPRRISPITPWGRWCTTYGRHTIQRGGRAHLRSSYNIVPWGDVALVKYGTNTNFVHGNGLQSSTIVTSQTGAVLQDLIFYPWGQSWIEHNGSVDGTFATMEPLAQGSGEETAITPNRDYSQSYGRWLSPDPLGGDVTNPQSLNRYAYALNNPTSFIDPLGLASNQPCQSEFDCLPDPGCLPDIDPFCTPPGQCDPILGANPPPVVAVLPGGVAAGRRAAGAALPSPAGQPAPRRKC